MKKLIGVLSSFVSIFSVSTTLVSCGNNKNQKMEENENNGNKPTTPDNNFVDSEIDTDLFETKLSDEGIDGSVLNTNSTGADTLILIKDVIIDIEPSATNIRFVNTDEETIFLSKGDNYFTVEFDVKNKNLEYPVLVKDVQDANELDKDELEIYVNGILNDPDILEVGQEDEDINTDDVTKWKKVIGQKIHEKAKNATINIKTVKGSKPGELKVTIEVDNLPNKIQKITKQRLYMSNKIIPNVNPVLSTNTFDAAVKAVNNWSFENNSLTTHNKKKDALNSIEKKVIDYFKDHKLPEPQFEYDMFEMNQQLNEGKNELKIGISKSLGYSNGKSVETTFVLNGVKKESEHNTYQNMIKERLSNGIDASKFNEKDSYESILPFLHAASREFHAYADIELKNKNQLKKLLKAGDNRIEVIVNLQGYQPVYFTALLKGVKSSSILEEVRDYYATERSFKQANPAYTYKSVIDTYQAKIKHRYAGVMITLKDSSRLNQKFPEGITAIEVNYSQNGKTLNGVIRPFLPITNVAPAKPSQSDFAKITPYVEKGITTTELKANLTTGNNLYEAFLAISKFIEALEPGTKVNVADPINTLNNKLKQGDNKINVQIYKQGMQPKKILLHLKM